MQTAKKADTHQVTPYPLRLPPELRQRLSEQAAKNHRSLNGEILFQLQAKQGAQQ